MPRALEGSPHVPVFDRRPFRVAISPCVAPALPVADRCRRARCDRWAAGKKRIDADVRTVLQRTGTPGATVLIAEHGRVVYRHTYGLRDREHLLPAGKQLLRNRLDYHKGYGQPTAFVFKGRHNDAGKTFNDYVIRFGPGSLLKFGVVLDKTGKIASISLG